MAPWVKLMMRRTEKISVYPSAKMAYTLPIASPFRTCWRKSLPFTRPRSRGYFTNTKVPLVPSGSILIWATYACFCTISPPMPGPVENEISPSGVS